MFSGTAAANTALPAAVTALMPPGPPRCVQSLRSPRTGQTASSGFAGSVPLLLLQCQQRRREFLLWMPSQNFSDRTRAQSLQHWSWSLLENEEGQQGPDELRAFPFNKSSSYLPFCCKVWRGIRLLMLALLSPGSWLTPYPFWSLL